MEEQAFQQLTVRFWAQPGEVQSSYAPETDYAGYPAGRIKNLMSGFRLSDRFL